MQEGEIWAYGTSDTPFWFQQVRVLKVEERRVLVAFLGEYQVERWKAWKSPRNLRVLWEDRHEFLKAARIRRADSSAEFDAAEFVFSQLVSGEIASIRNERTGEVFVNHVEQLASLTGLSVEQLSSPNLDCYVIAKSAMAVQPDLVLRAIEEGERDDRYEAIRDAMNSENEWWYMQQPEALERLALDVGRLTQRRNATLRAWAGEAAVDTARENAQLHVELLSTRLVARKALDTLTEIARTLKVRRLIAELENQLSPGWSEPSA